MQLYTSVYKHVNSNAYLYCITLNIVHDVE